MRPIPYNVRSRSSSTTATKVPRYLARRRRGFAALPTTFTYQTTLPTAQVVISPVVRSSTSYVKPTTYVAKTPTYVTDPLSSVRSSVNVPYATTQLVKSLTPSVLPLPGTSVTPVSPSGAKPIPVTEQQVYVEQSNVPQPVLIPSEEAGGGGGGGGSSSENAGSPSEPTPDMTDEAAPTGMRPLALPKFKLPSKTVLLVGGGLLLYLLLK